MEVHLVQWPHSQAVSMDIPYHAEIARLVCREISPRSGDDVQVATDLDETSHGYQVRLRDV